MILLTLSRGKGEETVRLQLPASPAEIGETFAFLDRISLDTTATAILDVSSNVPVLYRCLYDVDVEDSEQFQKLQKLIMEQLLEGPQTEGAKSAIPAGTKLINVSVVDGVCYVSLDENFKNQDYQVNEAVVIYSIVDSLTELSTISKVQISVNGDTSGTYRDNFKLSDMYDRNLDYVVSLEETGVTEEE